MKSTREKILRTLLAFPESTINDLAEAVGINGISIRHHLTALEADDLVTSSEQRHGVGRPRLIYSLTEKGTEEFPSSYVRLTQRLIEALEVKLSPAEVEKFFAEIGASIAKQYANELDGKGTEERLKVLKSILTNEGFIVEWHKDEDTYTLTSLSCPYYRLGLDYPEICALGHTMIKSVMATPVEIETCILENNERCVYHIQLEENA
jgi:predicted ArsR family transcriptional regulator